MPATSSKQRVAAAIAEHHPEQLYARNKSMLKMNKRALHEYAATKGLGKSGQRHDHTPSNGGFAHAGTTREGPRLSQAKATGGQAPGAVELTDSFSNADTLNVQPHEGVAGAKGASAGVAGRQEPKGFANSGTSRQGPNERGRATTTASGGQGASMGSIRRRGDGFQTNMSTTMDDNHGGSAGPKAHFGVARGRKQAKGTGGYEAARPGNLVATDKITGPPQQQGPKAAPARGAIRQNPAVARKLNRRR
ncbi:MAG TPA: hypothetical protein VKC15_12540 [Gemmatimonadales bacterium]|nr:hypothetical protein [Gemmatimonadales bacterium]